MSRPLLLDLFCGAGGAATGYHRAGFDVVGVDNRPQPRYPFEFHQMDALHALSILTLPYPSFMAGVWSPAAVTWTAIHASPPCQDYSRAMRHLSGDYPRLIDPVRDRLTATELPWVLENVVGAPLPVQETLDGRYGTELCGTMFGLPIWRHRLFETSFPLVAPRGCDHMCVPMNPFRGQRPGGRTPEDAWREAMDVGWMSREGARDAIPPAYTEYVGRALLGHRRARLAAEKRSA